MSTRSRLALVALLGLSGSPAVAQQEQGAGGLAGPVDAAVQRGLDWLAARQMRDGSWRHMQYGFVAGQTALSAYTLVRAGVPPDHPALVRALAWLRPREPEETYTAGILAMLWEATGDPTDVPRLRACVQRLIDWDQRGEWGYPRAHEGDFARWLSYESTTDLSNTQYALLGLRAGMHAGIDVPDRIWSEALDRTLALQEDERLVDAPGASAGRDKTAPSRLPVAGFRYAPGRDVCASMTAAGVGVLRMCRDALGAKLRGRPASASARGIQTGVAWLDQELTFDDHVGGSKVWQFYSIWGLERVGTLLGIESLGTRAWYPEGARWLLSKQNADGSWSVPSALGENPWHADQSEADTCFAILFLKRASRPVVATGGRGARDRAEPAADETAAVHLRASGTTTVVLSVAGFSAEALARFAAREPPGLRVESVEYVVDGAVIAAVTGDPSVPWTDAPYAVRHTFERAGEHRVTARVRVRTAQGSETLESAPVEVRSEGVLAPWMLDAATARERDLLADAKTTVTASSTRAPADAGAKACDGLQSTRWLCADTDASPALVIDLQRPVSADRIVLSPACVSPSERGRFDRITQVSVRLNRERDAAEVDLAADELEPTVWAFEKARLVSRIEIRVTARVPGGTDKGRAWFAEIALEKR